MDDDKRQIEFPPLQTHSRKFELFMIGLSLVCIVVVLVILLATNLGTEFRPTV
jgi:branched-subunit amino acid ABC-type transport system permease component